MNQNLPQNQKDSNDEVRISKKTIYTAAAVIGSLLLLLGAYFAFFGKKKEVKNDQKSVVKKDSAVPGMALKDSVAILKDSVKINKPENRDGEEGEEGEPYSEARVIAKTLPIGSSHLNFGDKVFVDDSKSTPASKVVYLQNPMIVKNAQPYAVNSAFFIDDYQFEDYKKNFSLPPFSELMPAVKKVILDENYSDGNRYEITQNADRAKSSISFGDYDGDGMKDAAVIMDNNEKQISHLLIICTNKATKMPYVAYEENYSDKVRINNFRKGSQIFMGGDAMQESPIDGVIANAEGAKIAIIYDKELQKFKSYTQDIN